MTTNDMHIEMIDIKVLNPAEYNPRVWDEKAEAELMESVRRFGLVDPIIANKARGRENIVIGGHFRLHIAKKLGFATVPVYYIDIPDIKQEQELNLRLNKNVGAWDWNMLANIDESILLSSGFDAEDLQQHFNLGAEAGEEGRCKRCEELHKAIRGHMHNAGHSFDDIVGELKDIKEGEGD